MIRRLIVAAAATIAALPTFGATASTPVDVAGCRVTLAYSIMCHREPAGDQWAWWVNQDETAGRLVERMHGTPEGQAGPWQPESLPAMAEAIDATCTGRPLGIDPSWVDLGSGVYGPPVLARIRWCESRDSYTAANPTSSARGAYQFLTLSWQGYGHADRYGVTAAHHATPAQQDEAAVITWQRSGTRPWAQSSHCWGGS